MKKILILSCVLAYGWIVQAQQTSEWNYPILPGTEEWKTLGCKSERVKACQIPESILHQIDTKELIELCLSYPYVKDIYAFTDLSNGIEALCLNFNGMRELITRKDAFNELKDLYQNELNKQSDLLNNNIIKTSEKINYKVNVALIEAFIGYPNMNLSKGQLKEALIALMNGYNKKNQLNIRYGQIEFESNFYARANIVYKLSSPFTKDSIKQLLNSKKSPSIIERFNSICTNIIQEL